MLKNDLQNINCSEQLEKVTEVLDKHEADKECRLEVQKLDISITSTQCLEALGEPHSLAWQSSGCRQEWGPCSSTSGSATHGGNG